MTSRSLWIGGSYYSRNPPWEHVCFDLVTYTFGPHFDNIFWGVGSIYRHPVPVVGVGAGVFPGVVDVYLPVVTETVPDILRSDLNPESPSFDYQRLTPNPSPNLLDHNFVSISMSSDSEPSPSPSPGVVPKDPWRRQKKKVQKSRKP